MNNCKMKVSIAKTNTWWPHPTAKKMYTSATKMGAYTKTS